MSGPKVKLGFIKLGKALISLEAVLEEYKIRPNRFLVDSAIKRFEYTIELFWKLLKVLFEEQGQKLNFPKEILSKAYMSGLIDNELAWLSMIDARNATSHTYDEHAADEVFESIQKNIITLRNTYDNLSNKFGKNN